MLPPSSNFHRIVFGRFEADLRSGELRKDGRRVRLQAKPFHLLALLLEHPGEVLTRKEICRRLWDAETLVDFDHSLGTAVNKIREALNDAADNPRYIETLPKRGYRFIGKISSEPPEVMAAQDAQESVEFVPVPVVKAWTARKWRLGLVVVAVVAAATVVFAWLSRKPGDSQPTTIVPFTSYPGLETAPSFSPDGSQIAFSWDNGTSNRTGRPGYDLYVKAMGSETVLRLTNHPSDWISSTWSTDGSQIAFHRLAIDEMRSDCRRLTTSNRSHFIAWPSTTMASMLCRPWEGRNANSLPLTYPTILLLLSVGRPTGNGSPTPTGKTAGLATVRSC